MGLKECPVCHARCFEDMDVCYGCLHSFERGPSRSPDEERQPAASASCGCGTARRGDIERRPMRADVAEGNGRVVPGEQHGGASDQPGATLGVAVRSDVPRVGSGPDVCGAGPFGVDEHPMKEETAEARAAAGSRLVHALDIVIGIRMAQDASDRVAAAATLPVWVEQADASDGWVVAGR